MAEPIRWIEWPDMATAGDTSGVLAHRADIKDSGLDAWAMGLVDELLATDYPHEFLAGDFFESRTLAALAGAGFLLMSQRMGPLALILPKLHLQRAVLDPKAYRIPEGLRAKLARATPSCPTAGELHVSQDIREAAGHCVARWGDDWLTPPLIAGLAALPRNGAPWFGADGEATTPRHPLSAEPLAFHLYRGNALAAVEFGVAVGRVYTSYSGTWLEKGAGSLQMAMAARWLAERGFALWDLGMPMDYKARLGAECLDRRTFVARFRAARGAKA